MMSFWNSPEIVSRISSSLNLASVTGEVREIPINEQVKTALIRVRKNPDSEYIFCKNNGKKLKDIRTSFFTALRKSGIK